MLFREIYRIIRTHASHCLHNIASVLQEYRFERQHGIRYISGITEYRDTEGLYRDSAGYAGISLANFNRIIDAIKPSDADVFVDLGCGKGRAVCFAALRNFGKVIGVEVVSEYADDARRHLASLQPRPRMPVEIHHADAATFAVREGTVFFMYNPFGILTLKNVLENIQESLAENPRRVRIVYAHPVHEWLLDKTPWLTQDVRLEIPTTVGKTTASIWSSVPEYNYRSKDGRKKQVRILEPV